MMLDELVMRCRQLSASDPRPEAITGIVASFVRDRASGPPPERTVFESLYRGDDLTIQHIVLPPGVVSPPHDHRMWAVVGIYAGEETNMMFRATPSGRLEADETHTVHPGETFTLAPDVVHAIANRTAMYLGGVHVYGGDLFGTDRTVWRDGEPAAYSEQMFRAAAEGLAAAEEEQGGPLTPADVARLMSEVIRLPQP